MNSILARFSFIALALSASAFAASPQSSRISPILRNDGATDIGSTLRLRSERLDATTITREDSSIRQGRDLRIGDAVTEVRRFRDAPSRDTAPARPQVEIDRDRIRRAVVTSDD